jgi:hypothetical protein
VPYSTLSAGQRLRIRLELLGAAKYNAQMKEAAASTFSLNAALAQNAKASKTAAANSWLHNQALFSTRRYAFYATLALTGTTLAVAKMGFSYLSALQQAQVALAPVITGTGALQGELDKLYKIAALTPFSFKEVTVGFRMMYSAMGPLGIGLGTMNQLIQSIADTLSFTGKVTPTALLRISDALQDMSNIGYVTGITVNRLERNGVAMGAALRKAFGLSGDQMSRIGELRIPAEAALKAFIKYAQTTPGIAGAALAQSNKTMYGAWSTFKDLLSQAAGQSEEGLFNFVHKTLANVNKELAVLYNNKEPITITNIVRAFDNQLSPSTHMLLNVFLTLQTALVDLITYFGLLFKAVAWVIGVFTTITGVFGGTSKSAHTLGHFLGVLTFAFIVGKGVALLYQLTVDAVKIALYGVRIALILAAAAQWLLNWAMGAGSIAQLRTIWRFGRYSRAAQLGTVQTTRLMRATMWLKTSLNGGLIPAFTRAMIATWAWFTSLLAVNGALIVTTITLWLLTAPLWLVVIAIIAAVAAVVLLVAGVVILYQKWKAFHDLVQRTKNFLFGTPGKDKRWWQMSGIDAVKAAFATGGTMHSGGLAVVGERGPEVVRLPAGANVTPVKKANTAPIVGATNISGGADQGPLIVQLVLRGRVLEEVVVDMQNRRHARR